MCGYICSSTSRAGKLWLPGPIWHITVFEITSCLLVYSFLWLFSHYNSRINSFWQRRWGQQCLKSLLSVPSQNKSADPSQQEWPSRLHFIQFFEDVRKFKRRCMPLPWLFRHSPRELNFKNSTSLKLYSFKSLKIEVLKQSNTTYNPIFFWH